MSDESAGVGRCTRCGTEFSGRSSPMGLCPACLLKLGLSDPSWTPPAATAERDPEAAEEAEAISVAPVPPMGWQLPSFRRQALVVVALLLLAVVIASFVVRRTDAPPAPHVVRFHLPLPDETTFIDGAQVAVSPDGGQLVVAVRSPAGQHLLIRSFASTEWRALPGTAGASSPFWSPDSRQVGFVAEGRLRRVDVSSGLLFTVLDLPGAHGAAWGSDGFIVFASDATGTLWRVRATGGAPEMMTRLDEAETRHAWPWVLPNPHQVLFAASGLSPVQQDENGSFLFSAEAGARQPLVHGGAAAYADGFLFSVQGSALVAQPFDAARGALRGDPQIVRGAEQIHGSLAAGSAFAVSSEVLVYRTGRPMLGGLTWIDSDGRAVDADMPRGEYREASLSPDGTTLAVTRLDPRDRKSNIWLVDLERRTTTRLTTGRTLESSPLWSPDGSRIAFVSVQEGHSGVDVASVSGKSNVERLVDLPRPVRLTDWSRDGRLILYSTTSMDTGSDIWALPLTEKGQPFAVISAPFNQSEGRLSPDGRWLAFTSNESGRDEIYVRSFPADEGRWLVSTGGGTQPWWRGDGSELHFVSSDGSLMATGVEGGDSLRLGAPRPLIELDAASQYLESGRRILAISPVVEPGDRQLEVVLNWAGELER